MGTVKSRPRQYLRIISAIAAKDIVDALKSKAILSNIVMVFFILVAYQWLGPLMYETDPDIVVYDPGGTRLVAALAQSPLFALHAASSLQDLKEQMAGHPRGDLGLVVPADFDQRLALATSRSGEELELSGYVIWSSRTKATELKTDYERQLTELVDQPVRIKVEGTVYPTPDTMGPIRLVAVTLVVTIIFIGTLTVPHLMFEEKQTRTIDAMLVSPASIGQVVVGKALAGLFYCASVVVAAFAFNWAFVVHWSLTIVAVLSGTLLAIALGLLLGTVFESRQQIMAWFLILGQLLLGPVFLSAVDPILPEVVRDAMYWIPTVALTLIFRYAFSDGATLAQILSYLGVVLATALLALALVIWKVRRFAR